MGRYLAALVASVGCMGFALSAEGQDTPPAGAKSQGDKANKADAPDKPADTGDKKGDKKDEKEKDGKEEKDGEDGKDKKDDKEKDDKDKLPDWLSIHGQATVISQGNWKFHSPYAGPNSLVPSLNYRTTETGTLYLDARVWTGGEILFNPEISGGRGLSQTMGLAGFPNGEATRVGIERPTAYIARLLFKQTIGLGGEQEDVEDGPNQLAGKRDISRLTFRFGKMAATDIFDDNAYSHDPRTQFMNWSLMFGGAWDYPANTRGYNYGFTADWNEKDFAVRYGIFGEPSVANGQEIDPHFLKANGSILEFEYRYLCDDRPGKLRINTTFNNAHMGDYRVSLATAAANGTTPDISDSRAYRVKYGFGINVEQEIRKDLGFFARADWNDGHTETWAFTEIDASASMGLLWKGKCWNRPDDTVGLAYVINLLSNGHRDYLAAGGLGFIIGDGQLHYAPEQIVETFYNCQLRRGINVTLDLQGVANPAYNRDRGPAAIMGVRVHFEY